MKIKWLKSELNKSVGSFLTPAPPPPTEKMCVCVGGRIGAPDDVSDGNTNFKTFKALQTIHYLSSYRFDLGLK